MNSCLNKIFLSAVGSSALLLMADPVKAITTFNGTATYACRDAAAANSCSITATNFKLVFDGSQWNQGTGGFGTGSLTLTSTTDSFTINNNQVYFDTGSLVPGSKNDSTGFTIALNPFGANNRWVTFDLAPAASTSSRVRSLYAIVPPTQLTGSIQPATSQTSVLSSPIVGVAAPGPLAVFAVSPFIGLILKRRSNKFALIPSRQISRQ